MDVRMNILRFYLIVIAVMLSRGDDHEQGNFWNSWPIQGIFDKDCFHEPMESYNGTWNITVSGRTCQRWDSQMPHKHKYVKMRFFPMEETLYDVHNYCRDTDNLGYFWCCTTDPEVRWEECNIPECKNSSYPTSDPSQLNTLYNISTFPEDSTFDVTTVFSNETNVTQGARKMVSSLSIILLQSIFSLSMYL